MKDIKETFSGYTDGGSAVPYQLLTLCVSLISFGKRMCKILFFWVSGVSWQYKLAVCNIYVHSLGESCKLLYELVSLLTDCWMLRKCALESEFIWELTQGVHMSCDTLQEVKRSWYILGNHFLVCKVWCGHLCMRVHECIFVWVCGTFLHGMVLWVWRAKGIGSLVLVF